MESYFNTRALRRAMQEHHMSQATLARIMDVSRSCINRILNNQRQPSTKVIAGLKIAFPEKPLDYFFTGEDFDTKE